jgi:DNA repair protein RadC
MTISKWPSADRPREKLLAKGAKTLTDAELVAIFINTGTREQTALDIAKTLLTTFGCLKKLLNAAPHEIRQTRGLGWAKYANLQAAVELGRRYSNDSVPLRSKLNNSKATQQFLVNCLRHYPNEVFACLFLDNHYRLIQFEELFHGTINEATIYPREIVRRALIHNAAHLILAHNHPSGSPDPSEADKNITHHIKQALALVDINVIDHIIIGNPENFSFAEAGII